MAIGSPYAPVGATVYSGYWREHYTVLSHNENGTVTIRWHGDGGGNEPRPEREGTHRTPLAHDDRIVSMPDGWVQDGDQTWKWDPEISLPSSDHRAGNPRG